MCSAPPRELWTGNSKVLPFRIMVPPETPRSAAESSSGEFTSSATGVGAEASGFVAATMFSLYLSATLEEFKGIVKVEACACQAPQPQSMPTIPVSRIMRLTAQIHHVAG